MKRKKLPHQERIFLGKMTICADKLINQKSALGVTVNMYTKLAALGVSCALFLSAFPVLAVNTGESDTNGDGKADQWIVDLGDDTFRVTKDRDFDGRVDYALVYTADGKKKYEEQDFNYDGEMDDFYYYIDGVLDYRTVDTNFDGGVDLFVYLDRGVYIWKIERDTDFDGTVDYEKKYGPPPEGKQ